MTDWVWLRVSEAVPVDVVVWVPEGVQLPDGVRVPARGGGERGTFEDQQQKKSSVTNRARDGNRPATPGV